MSYIPDDPDVSKYLAISENGVKEAAFFIDEIELTMGKILTGAVFSLPMNSGRLVMKVSSLSTFPDSAYAIDTEILAFDRDGRPLWSMEAPFAKIFPLTRDSGPEIAVLMRALDRTDKAVYWEPTLLGIGQEAPDTVQMDIPISWDNFILLSNIYRGISGISPADLKKAADYFGDYGYQDQIFQAELLRRFAQPLLFLPLAIFAVVIGWRYRALVRPRYIRVPMLIVLPLVFNGLEVFCRDWLNKLGIWTVVSYGFTIAAVFFGAGFFILLVCSLVVLAAQHS